MIQKSEVGGLQEDLRTPTSDLWSEAMREYVWLECTACGARNYRTEKETRGQNRLELKKFCRKERKHTVHKESRKK
jgi:large subunit ribosomal protein L33